MWPFSTPYPEFRVDELFEEYDYVVVGGGTAGCVLANRLSAQPNLRVLVVERGPVADTWASRVPLFSSDFASDGTRTIRRDMVPQQHLLPKGTRQMQAFSGSVLGGTSRINQMLYTRGLPAEYDEWREAGMEGWGWKDVRGCFLKSEKADVDVEGVHNTSGLWRNRTHADFYFRGFGEAVRAAESIGLPYIPDVNSSTHPPFGCARLHFTIDENAHRHSTYHAFLPKDLALWRASVGRLHVCTGTIVERLVTERMEGGELMVTGVVLGPTYEGKGVKTRTIKVRREVVLSAGPFGSPQILMLSGIGPAEHLKEVGITVVKDLPAVGANLQDHFAVTTGFNISMWDSLLSLEKRPWRFFIELVRYLIWGTGLLLVPVLQLAIFAHSKLLDERGLPTKTEKAFDQKLPDIEIMPMAYDSSDSQLGQYIPRTAGQYSFLNVLLAPASRGTVRLSSPDPRAPLLIDPAYLSNPADLLPLRAAVRLSLRLRDRMRLQGYAMKDATVPKSEADEDLDEWIRSCNRTTYHYTSTCRMGKLEDGEWEGGAVVDAKLRVYGVKGLRIADSSVFPRVPRTHTQAPSAAVGEKCAEMILSGV
ncbi:alcohol oxidase [Trametes versicolor FP-101664 SS1]|uniref:alcohol oxidase n=1 Tax=Trametes versicolor (strain FP-101664) TaxID=717944 RepID=UPI00046236C9|nr:alcohol oxidase [Trametes versicolor FP-101664 SS1]EIW52847.1 alcohol oxidase [Trametes versicolor FP-101664 SS1]